MYCLIGRISSGCLGITDYEDNMFEDGGPTDKCDHHLCIVIEK